MKRRLASLLATAGLVAGMAFVSVGVPAAAAVSDPGSAGTDFWLAFPGNANTPTLRFLITGPTAATGTVAAPGIPFSTPFTVTPGTVTSVTVPSALDIGTSEVVESLGIHVTADQEVSVYGLSAVPFSTEGYLGLPTDALGTDYIVLGYRNAGSFLTEFAVVASQDGTTVTINPTVSTIVHPAGTPYTVDLDQGETYQVRGDNGAVTADVTGSIVTSDKPIAVFGGHQCAQIAGAACNYVVEQMTPTDSWGTSFVTQPFATRTGDIFRYLAASDDTHVTVNGSLVATLNRGQLFEQTLTAASVVTSDNPILVAQYMTDGVFGSIAGDPVEVIVPPVDGFLSSYAVATPATGFANYINVVAPTASLASVTLDGSVVPAASFTAIPGSSYSGAQLAVTAGAHTLGGTPLGVIVYGLANGDAYGYPGGSGLGSTPAPVAHLTLVKTVEGGTIDATAWTLSASGPTPISGTTGAPEVTDAAVDPGTYTLSESGPSGYTAGDWSCDAGTLTGNSLLLADGDDATCSITNTFVPPVAHLTLVKTVEGGTIDATAWTLSAAGPTPISGTTGSPDVTDAAVDPGTYTLSESDQSGYTAGDWSCDAGTLTGNSLLLADGDDATCSITNTFVPPVAHLTLVKTVEGGTIPADAWTLSASGPTPISGTTGSPDVTDAAVDPGTYTLSESGPSGYTAGDWSCDAGTLTDDSLLLADGDDATCSITNTFVIVGRNITALGDTHAWLGLKNGDDQGTKVDLRVELLNNGTPVAWGIERCIPGLVRNPAAAKEAIVSWNAFSPVPVAAGDVLSVRLSARIGTKSNDTQCNAAHASAVGLRFYYDAASRKSQFAATIQPDPSANLYLHSTGGACNNTESPGVTARTLDATAPWAAAPGKCKDSGTLKFSGGNQWMTISTWSLAPLP